LNEIVESIGGTEINSGGLSISYYSKGKTKMGTEIWRWSPLSKLLKQENEILFIKDTLKVWIVWSRRRRHSLKFKLSYHVGCKSAFGDSVKLEKKFGSDEMCWIVVPKSDDFEIERVNTRRGVYETVKAVETQDSYGTLQNVNVVGDAVVTVANLAPEAEQQVDVKKLDYDGKQENIPINFVKSEISVNKAKVTAAVLVDLQCDSSNQQDCRETTFQFSMRALSTTDQSCIEREMLCRLNGTTTEGCADDLITEEPTYDGSSRSYPVGAAASDNELTVKQLSTSQCPSYSDILSDMLATNDTDDNEDTNERFYKSSYSQCSTMSNVYKYCAKSFNCNQMRNRNSLHYNPTCYSWCRFLHTFLCRHVNNSYKYF